MRSIAARIQLLHNRVDGNSDTPSVVIMKISKSSSQYSPQNEKMSIVQKRVRASHPHQEWMNEREKSWNACESNRKLEAQAKGCERRGSTLVEWDMLS